METIFWEIMTDFVNLIIPILTIRITFDYIRIFLFGGGN